jgi:beta-mannosidase
MGTLYWQINDTYPVASWSSLDYGGGWKLMHYMARRFYLPITVVVVPDGNTLLFRAVNDTADKADISLEIRAVDALGGDRIMATAEATTRPDKATVVTKLKLDDLGPNEFLAFSWRDSKGRIMGENDYFPKAYKAYDLAPARVTATWSGPEDAPELTLATDKPALFVTAEVDGLGYFSDNALTLLPGQPATLTFTPRLGAKVSRKAMEKSLKIQHLRETY